jgi:hypothetical protein
MLADMRRSLAGLRLTDENGQAHVVELRPPATHAEIQRLEETLPAPLPEEMRVALSVSTGLENEPLESFSLLDLEGFGLEEAFPHAYSIAHDGAGNYWVLDLLPGDGAWGPVFYACHDPPVIGYQAETIEAFLGHGSERASPGGASARAPISGAPAGNASGRSFRRSGRPDCCDASSGARPARAAMSRELPKQSGDRAEGRPDQ